MRPLALQQYIKLIEKQLEHSWYLNQLRYSAQQQHSGMTNAIYFTLYTSFFSLLHGSKLTDKAHTEKKVDLLYYSCTYCVGPDCFVQYSLSFKVSLCNLHNFQLTADTEATFGSYVIMANTKTQKQHKSHTICQYMCHSILDQLESLQGLIWAASKGIAIFQPRSNKYVDQFFQQRQEPSGGQRSGAFLGS